MDDRESQRPKGLPIGTFAPSFETFDIYGNELNLVKLLESYDGVLIDFFRGNW